MLLSPPFAAALNAGRNGVLYATRIRFVDGGVKALLYSRTSTFNAFVKVLDDTIEHASSLGSFALLYKVLLAIQRRHQRSQPWQPALAGFVGGFLIWGRRTRFNEMINLYISSRVLFALAKALKRQISMSVADRRRGMVALPGMPISPFRLWAALTWALLMFQFEEEEPLQSSLASSLRYIYRDSNIMGQDGWVRNLGVGAKFIPPLTAFVVVSRVLSALFTRYVRRGKEELTRRSTSQLAAASQQLMMPRVQSISMELLFAAEDGDLDGDADEVDIAEDEISEGENWGDIGDEMDNAMENEFNDDLEVDMGDDS